MSTDISRYDSESSGNYMAKPFTVMGFCKHYWLAILTLFCTSMAIIQASLFHMKLGEDAQYVLLPADLFLRHVRGFVVLFVLFSAISRVRLLVQSKNSLAKSKIWLCYVLTSFLMVTISLIIGYLIIPGKPNDLKTDYFIKYSLKNYTPARNFAHFFRGLAVHDIPGNMLTTRIENYNEFGNRSFKEGLGDGYNAPGFVVYGFLIALSLYSMGDSSESIQEGVDKIHKCLLGVYWMLVVYSPIAFYFAGIVTYDKITDDGNLKYVFVRYLYFLISVVVIALIRIFVVLPIVHLIRCRRTGFSVYKRIFGLLPTAFTGGSSVLMIEKTKYYLKKHEFDENIVDSLLRFCTLVNGEGIASGFAICAIFMLKLFGHDLDWSVVFKILMTGFLLSLVITEYIQGYLFGIIFFLNSSLIPPPAIVIILVVDWLYDRFRIAANVVSDSLSLDYIESLRKENKCDLPV